MPVLSARFIVEIESPCLLELPDGTMVTVTCSIAAFSVSARLLSDQGQKMQLQGDACWTTRLGALEVLVSRDEPDFPPAVVEQSNGARDLSMLSVWLRPKLPDFKGAALDTTNRVLDYFRFVLSTPLVRPLPSWQTGLQNPTWIDSFGIELPKSVVSKFSKPLPGWQGEFGVQRLTQERVASLESFLRAPSTQDLSAQLISDAQSAWYEGNLRIAVLELAICTEITVKRLFFSADSPAGSAYDYLEDKAKVSVRVLELLDVVSVEAFGQSFKQADLISYRSIDHMFRCRNKIAHRGELSYRTDSGTVCSVDSILVKDWWYAVSALRTWISSLYMTMATRGPSHNFIANGTALSKNQ